jgi:hypothetical protein
MKKTKHILLIIYILGLVFLGLRPKVSALYDGFLPSSDIGGWCMYQRYVSYEDDLTIQDGELTKRLEWKEYINHGSFTSSPHPKVSVEAMKAFVDFLSQNHAEVKEISQNSENRDSLVLTFKLIKIIEERDSIPYQVSKKIEL